MFPHLAVYLVIGNVATEIYACVSAFCRPGQPSSLARGDGYSSSSSPFCYIETIIDGDAVVKEKILKFSSPMPFPSDKNSKPPAP